MIRYLVIDVDGTLTDGKIYMGMDGELCKAFDIKDGYGIKDILPDIDIGNGKKGVIPIIITARESKILEHRCHDLNVCHLYQNCRNKKDKLIEVMNSYGESMNKDGVYPQVAYIGDDIIDLNCMKICQVKGCPADATDEVKNVADFISNKNGGNGAVREFIHWIIQNNQPIV